MNAHVHEQLPQDGEHETLKTVCKNTRLESTSKESAYAIHGDDSLCCLPISNATFVRLTVGLDYAQRVGHGVGEDGRAEANEGLAEKFLNERVRARQVLVEEVVRPEPLEGLVRRAWKRKLRDLLGSVRRR